MEQQDFPAQAVAMRRQLAQLSPRTYTDERRLVMDLILRLSFDCGRLEAPLPDQARIAGIAGMGETNVSRAIRHLLGCGMLRRRRGADGWWLFEPLPDAGTWTSWRDGKQECRLEWRCPDPEARFARLASEMTLALCGGPGPGQQISLGLTVEPTVGEEFRENLADAHRQHARETAGVLPEPTAQPAVEDAAHAKFLREYDALKARKAKIGRVGVISPDNFVSAETTARVPEDPAKGEPVISRDNSGPQSGGGVASPGNQLSHEITPRAGASRGRQTSHLNIPSKTKLQLTFTSSKHGMGDVAGAAGEGNGVGMDLETEARVQVLIGEQRWREWERWLRYEFAQPGGRAAAREALDQLKIEQERALHGLRDKIKTPGAWFTDCFCRYRGKARKPKAEGGRR